MYNLYSTYHKYTIGPPVCCQAVTFAIHHLRSHVFYGTTKRVRFAVLEYRLLAETKVCELDMAISIK